MSLAFWHAIERCVEYLPEEYLVFGLISKEFRKMYLKKRQKKSSMWYYIRGPKMKSLIRTPRDICIFIKYFGEMGDHFDFMDDFRCHNHLSEDQPTWKDERELYEITCSDLIQMAPIMTARNRMYVVREFYMASKCPYMTRWDLSHKTIYATVITDEDWILCAYCDYRTYKNVRHWSYIYASQPINTIKCWTLVNGKYQQCNYEDSSVLTAVMVIRKGFGSNYLTIHLSSLDHWPENGYMLENAPSLTQHR